MGTLPSNHWVFIILFFNKIGLLIYADRHPVYDRCIFLDFFEYLMHRFVFHFLAESERARKFIYVLHGNHHEYPRDKERLFMPRAKPYFIICYFPDSISNPRTKCIYVFSGVCFGLFIIWINAFCNTCMEPAL